jgi:hypothetical protein
MRAYLLAALLAAPAAILQAQTVDPRVIPTLTGSAGRTARIHVDSGGSLLTGAIAFVRADTLFLIPKSGFPQTVSVSRIARIDIREGLSDDTRLFRTRIAIVAGLLLGAGIGYEIAVPRVRRAERKDVPLAQIDYFVDLPIGALIGGAVGAVSGNAWPGHWVTRYP